MKVIITASKAFLVTYKKGHKHAKKDDDTMI